jgi:hypothetical protein
VSTAQLRGWGPLVGLVAIVVAAGLVLGPGGRDDGPPLDPSSSGGLGTKALVETLRALGARVDVTRSAPSPSHDTALLLADDLPDQRRRQIDAWVRAGGTLLVADPSSPLAPWERSGSTDVGLFPAQLEKRCSLPALRGVGRVAAEGAGVYDPRRSSAGAGRLGEVARCYPRNDGWWLVAAAAGDGNVVAVGGAGSFVNRHLDDADNAALIAALLVPRPGASVAFLRPPPPGATGRRSLAELVSPRVKSALWQLGIAFAVLALWRARRLGRPVVEPQPVQLEASELVVAVGELLQRSGNRARAAEVLREDLRRDVPEADALLATDAPPRDDAELVALAQRVEEIRVEVRRVPVP